MKKAYVYDFSDNYRIVIFLRMTAREIKREEQTHGKLVAKQVWTV